MRSAQGRRQGERDKDIKDVGEFVKFCVVARHERAITLTSFQPRLPGAKMPPS